MHDSADWVADPRWFTAGVARESNWMPCPAQGSWFILRMYQPRAEVVQAIWRCQPSERSPETRGNNVRPKRCAPAAVYRNLCL